MASLRGEGKLSSDTDQLPPAGRRYKVNCPELELKDVLIGLEGDTVDLGAVVR